jgi:hypothetical protein
MCLDYRALTSGTRVAQEPCDGWLGQRWVFDGSGVELVRAAAVSRAAWRT